MLRRTDTFDALMIIFYAFLLWSSGLIVGISYGLDKIKDVERDLDLYSKITVNDTVYSCSKQD